MGNLSGAGVNLLESIEIAKSVSNNDVVTKVPFWFMGYKHHGTEWYINHYGNFRSKTFWQRFKDNWRGRWKAIKKRQLFDGMYDHSITGYADKLLKILRS